MISHSRINLLEKIEPSKGVYRTCISYEPFFEALKAQLGPKLNPLGIGTRIFGYAWMEAAEREYTYLSLSNGYRKVFDVMRSIFYRTLSQAGIAEPRKLVSDGDMELVLESYVPQQMRLSDEGREARHCL
ncbi:hypothetical protein RBB50_010176 [Rhinocladiella similis]